MLFSAVYEEDDSLSNRKLSLPCRQPLLEEPLKSTDQPDWAAAKQISENVSCVFEKEMAHVDRNMVQKRVDSDTNIVVNEMTTWQAKNRGKT